MDINLNCGIKFFEGEPSVYNCKKNLSVINSLIYTLQSKIVTNKCMIQDCEIQLKFLKTFAEKINCELNSL